MFKFWQVQDNNYSHLNRASLEALHLFVGGKLRAAGEKMKTKVSAIMVLLVISKSAFNSDD